MKNCKCGCGEKIHNNKTYVSGHNNKHKLLKPRIQKVCYQCLSIFEGTEKQMENRKFCGNTCRDESRRAQVGEYNPTYSQFPVSCIICECTFLIQPSKFKKGQVHCSAKCGQESRKRKISGASRNSRPFGSRKAKVRDGFACRICSFDLAVHAHHIVPRKDGGSNHLDNLITLCPNHHALAHAGILTPDEMSKAIEKTLNLTNNEMVFQAKNCINYRK